MKGLYICTQCGKSLASSQSLWNHKQRCKDTGERRRCKQKLDDHTFTSTYPPHVIPVVSNQSSGSYQAKTNPKVQSLLDAIINEGIPTNKEKSVYEPSLKKKKIAILNTTVNCGSTLSYIILTYTSRWIF